MIPDVKLSDLVTKIPWISIQDGKRVTPKGNLYCPNLETTVDPSGEERINLTDGATRALIYQALEGGSHDISWARQLPKAQEKYNQTAVLERNKILFSAEQLVLAATLLRQKAGLGPITGVFLPYRLIIAGYEQNRPGHHCDPLALRESKDQIPAWQEPTQKKRDPRRGETLVRYLRHYMQEGAIVFHTVAVPPTQTGPHLWRTEPRMVLE